ncbi:hypothetical protein MNBD_BACTEROID07-1088 [hydrothermal vent metagenome]|uniref:Uncharacterized protein n=1 Tax=hydrothermal vent metagenome TaxID=652676 RepID=A0A3B0UVW5_9ZZZZ
MSWVTLVKLSIFVLHPLLVGICNPDLMGFGFKILNINTFGLQICMSGQSTNPDEHVGSTVFVTDSRDAHAAADTLSPPNGCSALNDRKEN